MKAPGFLRCHRHRDDERQEPIAVWPRRASTREDSGLRDRGQGLRRVLGQGKEALAAIPMDARLTPLPSCSTSKADVYQVER